MNDGADHTSVAELEKGTLVARDASRGEKVAPRREVGSLLRRVLRQLTVEWTLVIFLVALIVWFSVKSPFFLTQVNLRNIVIGAAVLGILAAPSTLLLISGNFDLSVGSNAALCGMVLALTSSSGEGSVALGMSAALLVGVGIGALNGALVSWARINSIITTLGMLAVLRGLTKVLSNGQTIRMAGFETLGSGTLLGIPAPIILLAVVVAVLGFVSRFTAFGRNVYAIGSNQQAARFAGIRTESTVFTVFLVTGLMAGVSGLVLTSQLHAASPVSGLGLELSVVAAVILGGASLSGGRGSIVGTVLAVLILGTLDNGLVVTNVSAFWQEVARGTVLITAVAFDQIRLRLAGR